MTFEPINGNEMQIDTFKFVIHKDDNVIERLDALRYVMQKAYKGECGHKVVRISQRNKKTTIFVNAGFEENMYNDVVDYAKNSLKVDTFPYVFEIQCFLSFSPLRDVSPGIE